MANAGSSWSDVRVEAAGTDATVEIRTGKDEQINYANHIELLPAATSISYRSQADQDLLQILVGEGILRGVGGESVVIQQGQRVTIAGHVEYLLVNTGETPLHIVQLGLGHRPAALPGDIATEGQKHAGA